MSHTGTPAAKSGSLAEKIEHIRRQDATLQAWAYLPKDAASQAPIAGPLSGVAFGVKDVIDVQGMPTLCGSDFESWIPAVRDAGCVAMLRAAGATPIGKTQTAEFAYRRPSQTRNPAVPGHTPGGSSSGSAAAVAAGMVALALSTQTGGSIIRPAAYCGVLGFKPSYGLVSRNGLGPGCESLDTIGWHAADIDVATLLAQLLFGKPPQAGTNRRTLNQLKVALIDEPGEERPGTEVLENLHAAMARLSQNGTEIIAQTPAQSNYLQCFLSAHRVIMVYELARSLQPVVAKHPAVSAPVEQLLEEARSISWEAYVDALALQKQSRGVWREFAGDADLIIAPSAPTPAPAGLENSGSSAYCRAWTFLGWPCLHLPIGTTPDGKPLGFQLVMPWLKDFELLAIAKQMAGALSQEHA